MMVTQAGQPVEFFLTGLEHFSFDLPIGSQVFGDKAYNHYVVEDVLEEWGIHLIPIRKSNSTRPLPAVRQSVRLRFDKLTVRGLSLSKATPKSHAEVSRRRLDAIFTGGAA